MGILIFKFSFLLIYHRCYWFILFFIFICFILFYFILFIYIVIGTRAGEVDAGPPVGPRSFSSNLIPKEGSVPLNQSLGTYRTMEYSTLRCHVLV